MKKYCYIPTGNEVWFDAAVDLYERGIARPVLWLGDDRHYDKAKKIFGDAVFRKQDYVFYPERIIDIEYQGEYLSFFRSENYRRAKDRCFKMMDRLDLYGTFSRLDREALLDKLTMWVLKELSVSTPDALVTSETPHSYTQYLLYEACLYLNIETVKFNTWNIIPVLSMKNVKTNIRQKPNLQECSDIGQKMDQDIKEYLRSVARPNDTASYELPYMRRQRIAGNLINKSVDFFAVGLKAFIKESFFQFRKNFGKAYYPINPYKLGILARYNIKRQRVRNLRVEFEDHQQVVSLETPYVYFALHFEPERSTNPDGDDFHDQLIAIANLRGLLPSDTAIYVKEHPSQFLNPGKGSRGRSPAFYNALLNMAGVTLVNENFVSLDLIDNSLFTATISGTAAFEAAIRGKTALIFGDAWFHDCPNVLKWTDSLSFDCIVKRDVSGIAEIEKYLLHERKAHTVPGCINHSAQKRHPEYLNENFYTVEKRGLVNLLELFFEGLPNV